MRKALFILGDLAEEDIVFLSRAGQIETHPPDTTLIRAGEPVRALYFVTAGALEVRLPGGGATVALLAVGDVIGEMSFVERKTPGADVVTLEESRLLAVPRDAIDRALSTNPEFAARFFRAMATFLSDRLRSLTAQQAGRAEGPLDEHLLDMVHVAGDRFRRLIELMERG